MIGASLGFFFHAALIFKNEVDEVRTFVDECFEELPCVVWFLEVHQRNPGRRVKDDTIFWTFRLRTKLILNICEYDVRSFTSIVLLSKFNEVLTMISNNNECVIFKGMMIKEKYVVTLHRCSAKTLEDFGGVVADRMVYVA